MSSAKNALYGDREEKVFGLLKIIRTSYPNDQHLFEIRSAGGNDDPRGTVAINAKPHQLLAELRRITTWLETQIGMSLVCWSARTPGRSGWYLWESNEEQRGDWDEAQQRLEVYTPKR